MMLARLLNWSLNGKELKKTVSYINVARVRV